MPRRQRTMERERTRPEDAMMDALPDGLERAGERVARSVHDSVVASGDVGRRAVDVLHGTWLGHPLHPVLTDVTIGSFALGAAFDAYGELSDDDGARRTGDTLTAIGVASAVPTMVTGLADYSAVKNDALKPATAHALLNGVSVALYGLSLRDRRRGKRGRGLLLSSLAFGISGMSAWIGGHMVYKHKVGVDHSESFADVDGWHALLRASDVREGDAKRAELADGRAVLVVRQDGEVFAVGAVCSHAGGPLERGEHGGCMVRCPWHDSVFDLRDGSVVHGPATQPQPAFDVRVRDGMIEVRPALD